ncbi:hypothetical protein [Microbacterium murale]|uniref:Peptidase M23 n=1 Tax=Microbacterium murale TaxID=1081040 RepID=A0ABU0P6A8_9MICO|nr:hypothetical protein [Microbacterium murale]MDQ0642442.1 hypothetical protein [Microbacterium murale]
MTPRSRGTAVGKARHVSSNARARQRTKKRKTRRRLPSRSAAAGSRLRRSARPLILTLGALTLAAILIVLLPMATSRDPVAVCVDTPQALPADGVEGWQGEQLENAAIIMRTATEQGFARDGQILGIMAAMGESSLHNIDYGDWETSGFTNPDGTRTTSIGLFQQQEWWGSVEARMDPAASAALFYGRLVGLAGWQDMEPSYAIHRVQVNSDPNHYARFGDDAAAIVDALSGPCPA